MVLAEVQHGHDVGVDEAGGDAVPPAGTARACRAGARVSARRILTATGRSRRSSKASKTRAMPPSPSRPSMRYRPPIERRRARLHPGCVPARSRSLVVGAGGRRPAPRPGARPVPHGVSAGQPASAAISPIRVSASAGERVAEVAVEGVDVGDDPLGFAPAGVGTQIDVAGCVQRRHAGVEARRGPRWSGARSTPSGPRAPPASPAGRDPARRPWVGARGCGRRPRSSWPPARPRRWVAAVEEDVPGEDDALVGQVDDGVARRVGRADLEQRTGAADVQVELVLEGPGGQGRAGCPRRRTGEDPLHELAGGAERSAERSMAAIVGGWELQHLLGAAGRRDDLRVTPGARCRSSGRRWRGC